MVINIYKTKKSCVRIHIRADKKRHKSSTRETKIPLANPKNAIH